MTLAPWGGGGGMQGQGGPEPVGVTESGATQYKSGPQGYPGAVEDHPGWNYHTGTCSAHPSGCADSALGAGTPHPWKGDLANTAAGREAGMGRGGYGSEREEMEDPYSDDPRRQYDYEGDTDENGDKNHGGGLVGAFSKWTLWGRMLTFVGKWSKH